MHTDTSGKEGLWGILLLRLEGTLLRTQGGVFDGGHDALLRVKAKVFSATRDRKGLLEVFNRLPQVENLVCKRFLSRDGNIGSVLSPYDIGLIEVVKLPKKEGSSLLMRYSILGITPRTSPHPRLSWGRCTVFAVVIG